MEGYLPELDHPEYTLKLGSGKSKVKTKYKRVKKVVKVMLFFCEGYLLQLYLVPGTWYSMYFAIKRTQPDESNQNSNPCVMTHNSAAAELWVIT